MTTVSAPGGIGAPVKIRTAVPAARTARSTWPAAITPTTGSVAGRSAERAA